MIVSNLLFISGGAYSAGDLELGRSHAPIEGSLIELGDIGLICLESFDSQIPYKTEDQNKIRIPYKTEGQKYKCMC